MVSVHKKRKDVLNRLSRIEGHVRAIKRMVEEDRSCPDLLHQVAAVNASLDKVGKILLEDHLETCLIESVKAGDHEKHLSELKEALSKFF